MRPSSLFSKKRWISTSLIRDPASLAYAYSVSSQFQTAKINERVETADLGYAVLNKINCFQLGYEL